MPSFQAPETLSKPWQNDGQYFPLTTAIGPLDYMGFSSAADVHAELEKTCHSLAEWFGSLEAGLDRVLDTQIV